MPGLTSVLSSSLSGLRAAQSGLGVASQNIANANTAGYVRTEVVLAPRPSEGGGVEISGVRTVADRFLAAASHIAEAARGASAVRAGILDRAQISFGDPASSTSLFAPLDDFWSALTQIGVDPASALRRAEAVGALQTMFREVQRVGQTIQSLAAEADQRIADAVEEAQGLIDGIAELNAELRLSQRAGADLTATENARSALIDQLAALMDIRVSPAADGSVQVRTSGGALLVGVEPARLSYAPSGSAFAAYGGIRINEDLGAQSYLEPMLLGGEIRGLLDVRDRDLAGLAEALGGFASALADALNEAHNESASSPAVSNLTGRQTGLLGTDAIGFTGRAIVGIADAGGNLKDRLSIDFGAQTITAEAPAATYSFAGGTINNFVTALNAALGAATPSGAATFSNGALALNVGASGGLVTQQGSANPSDRAGRGFAHFFGLNDVVSRATPYFFQSGVQGSDAHGFVPGGEITYQVRDSSGRFIADRTVSISGALANPGSNWTALTSSLNALGVGLGDFGAFSLDSATGQVSFAANAGFKIELVADTTRRGATGVSFSALNGLSSATSAGRALELSVDAEIASNPSKLAVGKPDLSVALGARIIEAGDNRGAAALLAARDQVRGFPAAGVLTAQSTTLATYAARLGGEAGRMASEAARAERGAEALAIAAGDRRAQVEGVSLDDELMRMTTFQNAYAAAARVIQAATDMLDVLLSLGYR